MPTSQETAPNTIDVIKRELSELFGDSFSFEVSYNSQCYRISMMHNKPGLPVIHLVYNTTTKQISFEKFTNSAGNAIIDQENSIGIILHIRYIFLTRLIERDLTNIAFNDFTIEYKRLLYPLNNNAYHGKTAVSDLERALMCLFIFNCLDFNFPYSTIIGMGFETLKIVVNRILHIYNVLFPDKSVEVIMKYLSNYKNLLDLINVLSIGVNGSITGTGGEIFTEDLGFIHDELGRLCEITVNREARKLRQVISLSAFLNHNCFRYIFTEEEAKYIIDFFKSGRADIPGEYETLPGDIRVKCETFKELLEWVKFFLKERSTSPKNYKDILNIQICLWIISVLSPDSTPPVAACPARGTRLPEGGLFKIISIKIAGAFANYLGPES